MLLGKTTIYLKNLNTKIQDFQSAESVSVLMSEVITLQASRGQDLF